MQVGRSRGHSFASHDNYCCTFTIVFISSSFPGPNFAPILSHPVAASNLSKEPRDRTLNTFLGKRSPFYAAVNAPLD